MIRFHRNDLPAEASFGEAVGDRHRDAGARRRARPALRRAALARRRQTPTSCRSPPARPALPISSGCWPIRTSSSCSITAVSTWAFCITRSASWPRPVYCTKIASKLARTYTDRHGLKDLTRELLGVEISKQQQSSDWGAEALSDAQLAYAASDVLHLHALREKLDAMLEREGRDGLARAAFAYLPERVRLDLAGFEAMDVFSHAYP